MTTTMSLFSQNTVEGYVYDSDSDELLPGVNVFIPELQKGIITDNAGYFKLVNLPDGLFKIQFSYIGYKTYIKTVTLKGEKINITAKLHPVSIHTQEVIVTGGSVGSQHENAIKIENINKEKLADAAPDNIMKKLDAVPGISAISRGNNIATPVIRGLSTTNIVVLNNGIRMENYQFSQDHPYTIDGSDIKNVEIIKGPASLLYGSDAVGGVLNFVKQQPAPVGELQTQFATSYNTNDNSTVNSLNIKGSTDSFFGGATGYYHSSADYYDADGNFIPNTRATDYSAKLFGGYRNHKGVFKIYYDYNKLNLGITNGASISLIDKNSRQINNWYQNLDNHIVSSKNTLFFNKLKLNVDFSFQHNHRKLMGTPDMPVYALVDMSLNTFSWQIKGQYDFSKKNNLIVVTQGIYQNNTNAYAPVHVLPDYTTNSNSIAGLWQYSFNEKLFYQAGLRYDYKSIEAPEQQKSPVTTDTLPSFFENYNDVSFSTGFTYKILQPLLLRFNVASAYRTPSVAELLQDGVHGNRYEQGNRNFTSQRNIEFDLSLHYHTDKVAADISAYYNRIFDYIYLAPTNDTTPLGLDIYRYNQNNAAIYGSEVSLEYSIVNNLKIDGSYSAIVAKQDNGNYLPYIPQNKINVNLTFEKSISNHVKRVEVAVNPLYAFAQTHPHIFETSTDGYFLLNAFVKAKLSVYNTKMEVGIYANNLFNKKYYDHLSILKPMGYYDMGRNISLKLKINI